MEASPSGAGRKGATTGVYLREQDSWGNSGGEHRVAQSRSDNAGRCVAGAFQEEVCDTTQTDVLQVLPEIPVPKWVDQSACCQTIPGAGRIIWAEGYDTARVLVVLDNPGARETATGEPYVCGTRQTLLEVAADAGLEREDMYVTYLLKCRPHRKYDRQAAWDEGIPLLQAQIRTVQPMVLVCMGNTVVEALAGAGSEVKAMRRQPWEYAGVPAVVTYHPLAIRRRPNLRRTLLDDMRRTVAMLSKQPVEHPRSDAELALESAVFLPG